MLSRTANPASCQCCKMKQTLLFCGTEVDECKHNLPAEPIFYVSTN